MIRLRDIRLRHTRGMAPITEVGKAGELGRGMVYHDLVPVLGSA